MSTERGPILRKRGNQPPADPPAAAPEPAQPAAASSDAAADRGGDDRRGPAPARTVVRRDGRIGRDAGEPVPRSQPAPYAGRDATPPRVAGAVGRDATPARAAGAVGRDATPRPAAPAAGRRFYDPRAERGGAPSTPAGKDAKGAAAKRGPAGASRPLVSDEKTELKAQAQKLAKEKGVPLVHAYRILKGQTTLNDVLKGMMRKERFEQLVAREGVDRELAGQVASGHLPKQRAVLLTRMRTLRKQKLHIDGIKAAEVEKKKIGVSVFGKGWMLGRVRAARPYDFDFLADGAEKAEKLFKHDVKAVCTAEDFDAAKAACEVDAAIQKLGLAQTEDREQRVRPTDDTMLKFIDDQRIVRFTMRDGEQILGRLRSFGRWDAELVLEGGELITVFFHGLHASSLNLGHTA